MRILHVVESLDPSFGGLSKAVSDMSWEMALQGGEVTVACSDAPSASSATAPSMMSLRNTRGGLQGLGRFGASRALSRRIAELASLSDVVHIHGLWRMYNIYAARAASAARVPFVVSTHGMLSPDALKISAGLKRGAWWAFQRRILNAADAIHVTSEQEYHDVSLWGLNSKIIIIPHGFRFNENPLSNEKKSNYILFLGRLHKIKNINILIDAWRSLAGGQEARGWELLIAGSGDEAYTSELKFRAEGVPSIRFLGSVESVEKEKLLAGAAVVVLPSQSENFGLVVLEALAQATPVICTTGSPWEELARRGYGLWVDPTLSDLKGAILWFLQQTESKRTCMGQRGREWARATYSLEGTVSRMLALYRDLKVSKA